MAKFALKQLTIPTGTTSSASDGAITASDNTFTSAGASFAAGNVGQWVVVDGAGAGGLPLITTIASINSGTSVELTDAASTTVSGANYRLNVLAFVTSDWTDTVVAARLWATKATAVDTVTTDAVLSYGFTDGATEYAACGADSDNGGGGNNDAKTRTSNDSVLYLHDTDGTLLVEATFDAFGAGAVAFSLDTNDDGEYVIVCELIYANNAAVGVVYMDNPSGTQEEVDLGWEPEIVFTMTGGVYSFPHTLDDVYIGHGICVNDGSQTQVAHGWLIEDNASTHDLHQRLYQNSEQQCGVVLRQTSGAQYGSAKVASFGTVTDTGNGGVGLIFETTYMRNASTLFQMAYLAIQLTSDGSQDFALVDTFQSETSGGGGTGEDDYTSLSFEPGYAYRMLSAMEDSFDNASLADAYGMAMMTENDQFAVAINADDGGTDAKSIIGSGVSAYARSGTSVYAEADFVEFLSNGITDDWQTVPGTAAWMPTLFIESWAGAAAQERTTSPVTQSNSALSATPEPGSVERTTGVVTQPNVGLSATPEFGAVERSTSIVTQVNIGLPATAEMSITVTTSPVTQANIGFTATPELGAVEISTAPITQANTSFPVTAEPGATERSTGIVSQANSALSATGTIGEIEVTTGIITQANVAFAVTAEPGSTERTTSPATQPNVALSADWEASIDALTSVVTNANLALSATPAPGATERYTAIVSLSSVVLSATAEPGSTERTTGVVIQPNSALSATATIGLTEVSTSVISQANTAFSVTAEPGATERSTSVVTQVNVSLPTTWEGLLEVSTGVVTNPNAALSAQHTQVVWTGFATSSNTALSATAELSLQIVYTTPVAQPNTGISATPSTDAVEVYTSIITQSNSALSAYPSSAGPIYTGATGILGRTSTTGVTSRTSATGVTGRSSDTTVQ